MSRGGRKIKERLWQEQDGKSALTGRPLIGSRLSVHHEQELSEGGRDMPENRRLMTIEDQAAAHIINAGRNGITESKRRVEIGSAMEVVEKLDKTELQALNEELQRRNIRIKFL